MSEVTMSTADLSDEVMRNLSPTRLAAACGFTPTSEQIIQLLGCRRIRRRMMGEVLKQDLVEFDQPDKLAPSVTFVASCRPQTLAHVLRIAGAISAVDWIRQDVALDQVALWRGCLGAEMHRTLMRITDRGIRPQRLPPDKQALYEHGESHLSAWLGEQNPCLRQLLELRFDPDMTVQMDGQAECLELAVEVFHASD